jgi:DNA-binding winged helix-turn-helix (wHTH) protein
MAIAVLSIEAVLSAMAIRFCDCILDPDARALVRDGVTVHLTPKAFDVLALLLSERPRALKKGEILDRVWPGTFVTDASLTRTIHEIRDAIGDERSTTIRTVHGHGYAFAADAVEEEANSEASAAAFADRRVFGWLLVGVHSTPLLEGIATIGRDPTTTVPLQSPQSSWHHARLEVSADHVRLEDLGSKNGTLVRGERITGPIDLQDGDDIIIGATRLVFRSGEKLVATVTDESR